LRRRRQHMRRWWHIEFSNLILCTVCSVYASSAAANAKCFIIWGMETFNFAQDWWMDGGGDRSIFLFIFLFAWVGNH
jgi:hypothetical protein